MSPAEITPAIVAEHGFTPDEYDVLVASLGRVPNMLELGIFSVMWSEHCSYKSSRIHLAKLPTKAPWVIHGPGENAGVIDIGAGPDGVSMATIMNMDSHTRASSSPIRVLRPASAASCATSSPWARAPSPT